MAEIGKVNKLQIKRIRDYGAHLDGGELGDILISYKHLPKKARPGDDIEVFIYQDKANHLRATVQKPFVTVGRFARLRVVAKSSAGAFMDWGMQKDLLVPKSEQTERMDKNKAYIVYVFLDEKTNRITASSKLDKFLNNTPPDYKEAEEVDLLICEKTDMGYKAIVNNTHWGVVYKNEVFKKLLVGQELKGYIKKIRADGKIDLSLQQSGYQAVGDISAKILKTIRDFGGRIPLTDKSPPEDIYSLFGVSKKVFKKAIGALYKKRLIKIDPKGITLIQRKS